MSEETPEEKMVMPVIFNQCPVCGSTKRLAEDYIRQLKDEGVIPKDFGGPQCKGLVTTAPLIDQLHPPAILGPMITVPVLQVFWDVCGEPECGALYCTRFDCVAAPAQVQQQPPPPPQFQQKLFMQGGLNRAQRRHPGFN